MNLSTGGMFIRSADPPPVGTRIRIEVEWASTVIPLAEAEVVWCRNTGADYAAGFGLRFLRMDHPSKQLIDALVKHGGATAPLRTTAHSRTKSGEIPTVVEISRPEPPTEPTA